ncbi:MAG TPA: POTRA domain-containing protein, partial [Polyangiaceae bacterium]
MGSGSENARRLIAFVRGCLLLALFALGARPATARAPADAEPAAQAPLRASVEPASAPPGGRLAARAALSALIGKTISSIEVVFDEPLWAVPITVTRVRAGHIFTPEVARRALEELAESGRYGELSAEVIPSAAGVALRLHVVARRIIAGVRVSGVGDADELLRAAGIRSGIEVTARDLRTMVERLEQELGRRGYPHARARVEPFDTDDPLGTVLEFDVTRGAEARIAARRFFVWPDPRAPRMANLLRTYGIGQGDLANLENIEKESRALEQALRAAGYFDARVEHSLVAEPRGTRLEVKVYAGSFVRLRFQGNRHFDARDLLAALELEQATDRSASLLAERVREFYVQRGFLDVDVSAALEGEDGATIRELLVRINEGGRVRVVAREFPCLTGERSADELGSEIDSFLSELPGGTLVDAVDPENVDALFGPTAGTGRRKRPLFLNPWSVYTPEVYESALDHLRDLYRSEGYLSATVGPVTLLRRTCDVRSPPGRCIPRPAPPGPLVDCRAEAATAETPVDPTSTCRVDRARGVYCEPDVRLSIPIRLGPRSFIRTITIDGNLVVPDEPLLEASELAAGAPVSQVELERARRRLLELYAEEGFAFSEVEVDLDLSPDQRHADVRFIVSERKRVHVSRIVVRGARVTSESVIRRRIALEVDGAYRRSLVRMTEERLGTLGVFSSVTVGLEDPYVPASRKAVIVTVQEKKPQYLDVRPGFSTGEGFRILFEYGHRNLWGQAIQLTLRSQLGFLPSALILEDSVRAKYEELDALERLERRNTATVEFPEIGLGPLFRLRVEGVDVRDNARDYGLTKDAGILSLFFLPERRLWFELGGSLERNDA